LSRQPEKSSPKRLSLGVIFLTIFIDLVGFSVIFPLFPAILDYYLERDGQHGMLAALLEALDSVSQLADGSERFTPVLFGGVLGSLYAVLQFFFAPLWGSVSDRKGRRPILMITTLGTCLSYVLWLFAGNFALLIVALVGLPLIWAVAAAFAEGEVRRRETPVRALLGGPSYDALSRGEETPQHYMGNDRLAPDFELPMGDGSTWRLSDHRGKVVVLNFWSVTCRPCIEEMPSLISLANILEGRDDIELLAVSADRDWRQVREVVPERSRLTVLLDDDRSVVREQFGTRLFPETWIIDPEGVIRLRVDGRRDWSSAIAIEVMESYL